MSKQILYGSSFALTISIIVLALSTYGLGREEKDKLSPGYKSAEVFAGIGAATTIISLLILGFAILRTKTLVQSAQSFSAPNYKQF